MVGHIFIGLSVVHPIDQNVRSKYTTAAKINAVLSILMQSQLSFVNFNQDSILFFLRNIEHSRAEARPFCDRINVTLGPARLRRILY